MSVVGVGIGDIWLIINGTIVICKNARDATKALQAAEADLELTKSVLAVLKVEIGDEISFLSRRRDIASFIKYSLVPLRNDLVEIEGMLKHYNRDSLILLDRVRYAVLDKNRLDELRGKFVEHRHTIHELVHQIRGGSQAKQTQILSQIKETQEKEQAERQSWTKKLEEMLRLLNETYEALTLIRAGNGTAIDLDTIFKQLEDQSVCGGSRREEAKARLHPIRDALLAEALSADPDDRGVLSSISNRERNAEVEEWLGRMSIPQSPDPVPLPITRVPPFPTTRVAPLLTTRTLFSEDCRILCIDERNSDISVLAQTFFEIMRLRIAHGTGRWIFKRVDSAGWAGYNLGTAFGPNIIGGAFARGLPVPSKGLSAVDPKQFEWSLDYPNEVSKILIRQRSRRTCALHIDDFSTYNLVICFHRSHANLLEQMKMAACSKTQNTNVAKIVYLPGCEKFLAVDRMDPKTRDDMVATVQGVADAFVLNHLSDWYERRKVPVDQRYRTLQFVMKTDDLPTRDPLCLINDIPKVKEWERTSGCSIRITKISNDELYGEGCLVSVIGPRGSNHGKTGEKCWLAVVEDLFRTQCGMGQNG